MIGVGMTFGEAIRLTNLLANDPSSQVAAAISGWVHPFSWEAILAADTFDLHMAKAQQHRSKPWPRPWPSARSESIGSGSAMSVTELEATFARVRGISS